MATPVQDICSKAIDGTAAVHGDPSFLGSLSPIPGTVMALCVGMYAGCWMINSMRRSASHFRDLMPGRAIVLPIRATRGAAVKTETETETGMRI